LHAVSARASGTFCAETCGLAMTSPKVAAVIAALLVRRSYRPIRFFSSARAASASAFAA